MTEAIFASLGDYKDRYGAAKDPARVEALLEDASFALLAAYESWYGAEYAEGEHPTFDRNAKSVCCAMVSRSASVPSGYEGVKQATQTGGPYSEMLTYVNPGGDLYLTKFDRERLGLIGMRIGTISPLISRGGAV